jgi:hypothetical protein
VGELVDGGLAGADFGSEGLGKAVAFVEARLADGLVNCGRDVFAGVAADGEAAGALWNR